MTCTVPRSPRLLLGLAAVAVAFAAADTYVVVLALPEMMGAHRHPDRPAPARGADRLRLPARVRRDAAADRPDRRPARPGAGAGRGAGGLRGRLAGHRAGLRPAVDGRPAGSCRASAAAGWSRPPWRWSPTSTRSSAAAYRSASSPPSRSSARVIGPLFGAVVLSVADWRDDLPDQPGGRPGPGRGAPQRPRLAEDASDAAVETAGRRLRLGQSRCCSLITLVVRGAGLRPARPSWSPTSPGASSSSRSPATAAGSPRSAPSPIVAFLLFLVRSATASRPLVDLAGWVPQRRGRPTSAARCSSPSRSAA